MNIEQRKQIQEYCSRFRLESLIDLAVKSYPDTKTWNLVGFNNYTLDTLISITNKIFKQINEAAISEDYSVYSWEYANPLGVSNIGNEITNLLDRIEQKGGFTEMLTPINWLVRYLIDFDLWNKERAEVDVLDLEKKELELLKMSESFKSDLVILEKAKEEINAEKAELVKERTSLTQFAEQKKAELQLIVDSLGTVTTQKNEIDNIHKGSQQVDSDIRAIQKNHNDLYEQLKSQKEAQEKEFKLSSEKIEEENVKLKSVILEGDKKILYFQGLESFLLEKQKEIIELGGLAAGAALGGTFGLREGKLEKGLTLWIWAVPIITLLSMGWVIVVFTCLKSSSGVVWVDLILNIAKTIPAFVLMGFVFKQYSKERNLQEEYAFKAAIANTIKAYSDLLKNEDKPENASRQTMLSEAVKKVQTAPKLYIDNSSRMFSFSTRGLSDSIKNLNDTLTHLKPTK